jgi:serine/threonine protein phosphatase PrpC
MQSMQSMHSNARSFAFVHGSCALQGRRESMQDCDVRETLPGGSLLCCVFDGHGTHGGVAAQICADAAPAAFHRRLSQARAHDQPRESDEALADLDDLLRENNRGKLFDDSGTCALTALLSPQGRLQVSNVGDSRAFVVRAGPARGKLQVLQMSVDHKPDRPDETRRIEQGGGFVTSDHRGGPPRLLGHWAVSRALGDFGWREAGGLSAQAETAEVDLQPGDVVVLACDGVFDVLSTAQAAACVGMPSTQDQCFDAASRLALQALAGGSTDNLTAVVTTFFGWG